MVVPTYTSDVIPAQLDLYERQVCAQRGAFSKPSRISDLQALASFGLHLYDLLVRIDNDWAQRVKDGTAALTVEDARALETWYADWYRAASELHADVEDARNKGFHVEGAERLSEAVIDVALF